MRAFDYYLRDWRYRMVAPLVPRGSAVLDIGGYDGSFLLRIADKIVSGICIDPLAESRTAGVVTVMQGRLSEAIPFPDASFDVVTMMAVFEHLGAHRDAITAEAARVLKPGGLAILTIPAPLVDVVLKILETVRMVDADTLDEHQHLDPAQTVELFGRHGLELRQRTRFQLGLNNRYVFQKRRAAQAKPRWDRLTSAEEERTTSRGQ